MVAYKLRIELLDIEPAVVRTVTVPGFASFADLHSIIQSVMQWEDYYYHAFSIGFDFDADGDDDMFAAISGFEGKEIEYIYDPEAGWDVRITWLGETDDLEGYTPVLLDWEGNAPPEGCEDMEDFYRFRKAAEDPDSPDREEYGVMFEGWEFDPEVAENSLQAWGVQGVMPEDAEILDPIARMNTVMMLSMMTDLPVVFDRTDGFSRFVVDVVDEGDDMPDQVTEEELAADPGRYIWVMEDPAKDYTALAIGYSEKVLGKKVPEGKGLDMILDDMLVTEEDAERWGQYVIDRMSDLTFRWAADNGFYFKLDTEEEGEF